MAADTNSDLNSETEILPASSPCAKASGTRLRDVIMDREINCMTEIMVRTECVVDVCYDRREVRKEAKGEMRRPACERKDGRNEYWTKLAVIFKRRTTV